MKVKTYEGSDMPQIVAQIKSELGSDAVILHTRKKIKGGIWGFFGHEVIEVLAGIDINVEVPRRAETSGAEDRGRAAGDSAGDSAGEQPAAATAITEAAAAAKAAAGARHEADSLSPPQVDRLVGADFEPGPLPPAPLGPASIFRPEGEFDELKSELRALKQTVARLAQHVEAGSNGSAASAAVRSEAEISPALSYLLSQDVERHVAQEICSAAGLPVEAGTGADDLDHGELLERLAVEVGRSIAVTGHIKPILAPKGKKAAPKRPKSIAFIGPTGVGKTTTIAKLAARFALGKQKQVALVTADFFRIGAVRQLKTYAALTGIPLDVVHTSEELLEALETHADKDFVFIDTAGHSQNNAQAMEELRHLFAEADIDEYHLVLSATSKYADLMQIYRRFGVLPVNAFVLTKLDETTTYGPLISLLRSVDEPVSYLTDGQRVPEDIKVAQVARLSRLLVGGGQT